MAQLGRDGGAGRVFGTPVRVLNDAEVQGAAVIERQGLEVVFTLGTGLGCAVYDNGQLAPQGCHTPRCARGRTYDAWMGKANSRRSARRNGRAHPRHRGWTATGLRPGTGCTSAAERQKPDAVLANDADDRAQSRQHSWRCSGMGPGYGTVSR